MITGRAPYDGESPVAVAIQHINGGAAMPSTLNPNIPGGLEQIIMRAMAVDPSKRYASAVALLYDMEEFRKDPAMLFDFNNTAVDDALTQIQNTAAAKPEGKAQQPKTTAERVAGTRPPQNRTQQGQQNRPKTGTAGAGSQSRTQQGQQRTPQTRTQQTQARTQRQTTQVSAEEAQRRAAQRERREQEEKRTRMITIAVISCSVVAVIAIVIFLVMLLNGGLFGTKMKLD